jgi:hypothetical protein
MSAAFELVSPILHVLRSNALFATTREVQLIYRT